MHQRAVLLFCILHMPCKIAADDLDFENAEVVQHTNGLYRVIAKLNQGPASAPDQELETELKRPENYTLRQKSLGGLVDAEAVQLALTGGDTEVYQVTLGFLDMSCKEKYELSFRGPVMMGPVDAVFREPEEDCEEFEKGKAEEWHRSITPKLLQGENTSNEIGDIGFDVEITRKLPRTFELDLQASITPNKDDANNNLEMSLFWRPFDLLMDSEGRYGTRLLSLEAKDTMTQSFELHDITILNVHTTWFLRPVDRIQPVFVAAGVASVRRESSEGEDFDDPRFHLQAQWGMLGLFGRGSRFLLDWNYMRQLDKKWGVFGGDATIDETLKEDRFFYEATFQMPMAEGKNLTVTYKDGELSPTFDSETSVQLGLQLLFGDEGVLGSLR